MLTSVKSAVSALQAAGYAVLHRRHSCDSPAALRIALLGGLDLLRALPRLLLGRLNACQVAVPAGSTSSTHMYSGTLECMYRMSQRRMYQTGGAPLCSWHARCAALKLRLVCGGAGE